MLQETQRRNSYYKDDNFSLEYEVFNGCLLLHCEVKTWNASVLRRCYSVFSDLQKNAFLKGYEKLITVTPNPKFAKLFNGTMVNEVEYGGEKYEVIEWDLNLPR